MADHVMDKFEFDGENYILQDNVSGYITSASLPSASSTTPSAIASSGAAGSSSDYARADHTHSGVTSVNGNTGAVTVSVPSASTTNPSMDGTASYGSGTSYARSDHVHPTDTSRQAALVSGTNIKTVNGNSLLGSGNLVVDGTPTTWYGTSSTGATTLAKTVSSSNFVLKTGSIISVVFSNANTATSGALTLNVNSTGAKTIYYNNTATSSTNNLLWNAGEVLTFIYSGSYYYLIGRSTEKKYVDDALDSKVDATHNAGAYYGSIGYSDTSGDESLNLLYYTTNAISSVNVYPNRVELLAAGSSYEGSNIEVADDGVLIGTYTNFTNNGEIAVTSSGVQITNLITPTNNSDAATKQYVDNAVAGAGGGDPDAITDAEIAAITGISINVNGDNTQY